jgi:hypothetical protein
VPLVEGNGGQTSQPCRDGDHFGRVELFTIADGVVPGCSRRLSLKAAGDRSVHHRQSPSGTSTIFDRYRSSTGQRTIQRGQPGPINRTTAHPNHFVARVIARAEEAGTRQGR